jgi:hypothetical protein
MIECMVWTKEKIENLADNQIEALRENGAKRHRQDIVELCDQEIARRKPTRAKKVPNQGNVNHSGQYVSEFHFICPTELGISRNPDGTIWTGTWVVAEEHAEKAVDHGALVSLHLSKTELSYMQGVIKGWRKSSRQRRYSGEQPTQIKEGIDFLFQPSDSPVPWKGDATGEKGYAWTSVPE